MLAAIVAAAGLSLRSQFTLEFFNYNVPVGALIMLFGAFAWGGIYFLDTKWYSPFLLGSVKTGISLEKQLNIVFQGCFTHSSDIKAESNKVTVFGSKKNSVARSKLFHFSMIGLFVSLAIFLLLMSTKNTVT